MSRAKRFEEAQSKASEAKAEIEALRDELQEWIDNMPENLQGGQKADELQEAIDELDSQIDNLQYVEDAEVVFPGMF